MAKGRKKMCIRDSPYIALAIIVFTIVIYMLMLPLTIKQQKFSKLSNKMNPELQAIQKKYNGKKDNDSMMAMQNETQAVYAKYGVSPCLLYTSFPDHILPPLSGYR